MLYALGTGNYLNDKLESVVLVAPCIFPFKATYDDLVGQFMWFKEQGIYSIGGDDYAESLRTIRDNLGEEAYNFWSFFSPEWTQGPINSM